MASDWLREARPRMLDRPQPGCWYALIVRAIEPLELAVGNRAERTPAHYLLGAWAPSDGGLFPRLPEFAAIASPDATRALRELFVHLPDDAKVLLVGEEYADAALLAEMVLLCDGNLEGYQREALQRFADGRRERLASTIRQRYTDREAGFERFRGRLLGGADATAPDDGEPR
jgi:hypothetical protein